MKVPTSIRSRRFIFWIVVLAAWTLDTHGDWAGTGDEPHYAMIAHSLVFDRDFDLANDYGSATNLVNRGGLESGSHVRTGRDGIMRPIHDVGLPIVAAPYFAAAYAATVVIVRVIPPNVLARGRLDPPLLFRHLLSLGMIVVTALMALWLHDVLVALSNAGCWASAWTILFVLSPPLLAHSFLFFAEIPAATLVTWLYGTLIVGQADERATTRVQPLWIGLAIGFLPLLHVRLAGLALGFLLLYVWRRGLRPLRSAVLVFLPILGIAAFKVWLNERFWGTILTTPHVHFGGSDSVRSNVVVAIERLLALCFDQAHGLLLYAPSYLAVLPGVIVLWHIATRRCREILFLLACYLVPVALPVLNAHGWDGGWSPAARFLVPILPLLVIAGFAYVAPLSRWPLALSALAALQILLDALCWSHPKIMWNGLGPSALLQLLSPRGTDLSRWFPAWNSPSSYTIVVSICSLILWIAVSIVAARRTMQAIASMQPADTL